MTTLDEKLDLAFDIKAAAERYLRECEAALEAATDATARDVADPRPSLPSSAGCPQSSILQ